MMDQNTCFAYLNMELPDDIRRLKEAGYYDAAIARIDACLAEDWTASQNQPLHPQGTLPVNPTPHGVDAWRQGLLAHREILRRLPRDYTLTAEQLLNQLIDNGQIATQYVDLLCRPTMDMRYNPNGSVLAIEGITSPDGRVFGKMGHSERSGEQLYKNVTGDKYQPIFEGGVNYFKL